MRYVVIDTETSGFPEEGGRLVEVAARTRHPDIFDFAALCDPGHPIPPQAMAVHHITDQDVAGEPAPEVIVGRMMEDMSVGLDEEVVWVAHNAAFDRQFLPGLPGEWICTWRCAMHIWPDAPSHSNQVLRYWLGVDGDPGFELPEGLAPHRALYDIIVTEAILRRMLSEVVHKRLGGDADSRARLVELIRLSTAPVMLTTMRFGKHRGQKFVDLPSDYLSWMLRQSDMDSDVRHTASVILRDRR
jgi:exodeoxyribonuclease X